MYVWILLSIRIGYSWLGCNITLSWEAHSLTLWIGICIIYLISFNIFSCLFQVCSYANTSRYYTWKYGVDRFMICVSSMSWIEKTISDTYSIFCTKVCMLVTLWVLLAMRRKNFYSTFYSTLECVVFVCFLTQDT